MEHLPTHQAATRLISHGRVEFRTEQHGRIVAEVADYGRGPASSRLVAWCGTSSAQTMPPDRGSRMARLRGGEASGVWATDDDTGRRLALLLRRLGRRIESEELRRRRVAAASTDRRRFAVQTVVKRVPVLTTDDGAPIGVSAFYHAVANLTAMLEGLAVESADVRSVLSATPDFDIARAAQRVVRGHHGTRR